MFTEAYLEMNERNDDFHNKLPESSAKDYLDNYVKMMRKTDKDLDNLEKAFRLVGTSKYDEENYHRGWLRDEKEDEDNIKRPDSRSILDDIEPTSDLCKVNLELMEKYPMVRFMDDAHFGWRNHREAMEATLNYITMVEATYRTKKKIGEVKDEVAKANGRRHYKNILSQVNA